MDYGFRLSTMKIEEFKQSLKNKDIWVNYFIYIFVEKISFVNIFCEERIGKVRQLDEGCVQGTVESSPNVFFPSWDTFLAFCTLNGHYNSNQ